MQQVVPPAATAALAVNKSSTLAASVNPVTVTVTIPVVAALIL